MEIENWVSFLVDRAALEKMSRFASWDGDDLQEISVNESGVVRIGNRVVFSPDEKENQLEREHADLQKQIKTVRGIADLR